MNQKLRSFIKILFFLSIGITLLYLAFRDRDIAAMIRDIREADYYWVGLSILFSLLAFVSRAMRWVMLIKPLGYNPSTKNTFYALMVGYLANYAIPRIGEVTRCSVLNQSEKVPFNLLFGTVIAERTVDLFMLVASLTLAAALEFKLIGDFVIVEIVLPLRDKLLYLADSPVFMLGIIGVFVGGFVWFFMRGRRPGGLMDKLSNQAYGFLDGLKSVLSVDKKWLFIFHTVFIWVMYFFMSYSCFFALTATSGLSPTAGIFILAIGGIGMAAPVQGGIGAYHILVKQGLALFGIAGDDGLTYATLVHTSQMVFTLLLGALSMLLIFVASKAESNDTSGADTN